jgi:hypothetical protein
MNLSLFLSGQIQRSTLGGGATLSLAGGIRGRRKIKGGHFMQFRTQK